jgi:hypothetical protein
MELFQNSAVCFSGAVMKHHDFKPLLSGMYWRLI